MNHKEYMTKAEAAEYIGVPKYVLTTLDRIGRMCPDHGRFFKKYSKRKLDNYIKDAQVHLWRNDERILKTIKHRKTP